MNLASLTRWTRRRMLNAALLAVSVTFASGYSSCAGATGPLFAPLTLTPNLVLMRSSQAVKDVAVAIAKVSGGDSRDHYSFQIDYGSKHGEWLTVEGSGRYLTLHASPQGLDVGVYTATVNISADPSEAGGALQVEFTVAR